MVTPIFEHVEVFQRVGESTDVVRKEMYEFDDKGGRRLALRPEGTAPVVRAFVQHRPTAPWKVWYLAPHFRYERPQKGRYRQHWQLGAEVLGVDDPDVDVEVIALAARLLPRPRAHATSRLLLNSMGDADDRGPRTSTCCATYLARPRATRSATSSASGSRQNPLRVLDSKVDGLAGRHRARAAAHRAPERRGARRTSRRCRTGSTRSASRTSSRPRLVRGFDYYTRTTFEFASDALDAAQNAVGGGGRYDQLAEEMGGPPTPGIGFGIGIERVLIALRRPRACVAGAARRRLDAFVVDGARATATRRSRCS